jgi:predicted transcriptional regulator
LRGIYKNNSYGVERIRINYKVHLLRTWVWEKEDGKTCKYKLTDKGRNFLLVGSEK